MQITVVAVMCHTLGAITPQSVDTLPDPICREVIIIKDEMPMQSCMLSQPALADWSGPSTVAISGGSAGSNACRAITCRRSAFRRAHRAVQPLRARRITDRS